MARSWWARRQLDQSRTCCRLCFPCHSRRVSRWRTSGTLRRTPPGRVFFSSAAQHRQHGVGQHGQGDVTLPSLPVANLVVVQPTLSLGRLEALFDLPALSSHATAKLTSSSEAIFRAGPWAYTVIVQVNFILLGRLAEKGP